MLCFKGTLAKTNGLVKVTVGTKLENEVDVVLGLERLKQVDDMSMITDAEMDAQLLRALINCESGRAVDSGRGLGDDLDGNVVARYKVFGLEDHAKGAMVEWGNGFVSSIEHNAIVKLIAHTIHKE
jgi:hypothetical protein